MGQYRYVQPARPAGEESMMRQTLSRNFYNVIYLFMIGLFLGVLLVNLGYDAWVENGSLLDAGMVLRLKNSAPDGGRLFPYIVRHRLGGVCMLGLLSTTVIGLPAVCGYICYCGLAAGCLLSVAVIRYGIRGLFLMTAVVFPQGFLLIPAYMALFVWTVGFNRMLYSRSPYREPYMRYSRQFYIRYGLQMAGVVAVVIMGALLESYVNPKMLHFVLKIF